MELQKTTFNIAMMSGNTKEVEGYLFTINHGGLSIPFVAHRSGRGWGASHLRTGRLVDHGADSAKEIAEGFALSVEVGGVNLAKLVEKSRSYPAVNYVDEVAG